MAEAGFVTTTSAESIRQARANNGSDVLYPSPWQQIARKNIPSTFRDLFRMCYYYATGTPLVTAVVQKKAEYPITDVLIQDDGQAGFTGIKDIWERILKEVLNMQAEQVAIGLDYQTYGNCLMSINYPFDKMLVCGKCKGSFDIKTLRHKQQWRFTNWVYELACPKCGHTGVAGVNDRRARVAGRIRLKRWNPSDIRMEWDPFMQTGRYAYDIPERIREAVLRQDVYYLQTLSHAVMESIRLKRRCELYQNNVFHFRAPSPSTGGVDEGWGVPPILPAFPLIHQIEMMYAAQEKVLKEHIVPTDLFFPMTDGSVNPFTTINLTDWRNAVAKELQMLRTDPLYKPIFPTPIGTQRLGGQGRALMLVGEIQAASDLAISGMKTPREFVTGGLSYSGSSVSLRMLENEFMLYRDLHHRFLNQFLIPNIAAFLGIPPVRVKMRKFRMADDAQAKQLLSSLYQMQLLSPQTLLAEYDLDADKERDLYAADLVARAEIQRTNSILAASAQGEAGLVQARHQVRAQQIQADAAMRQQQAMQAQQQQAMQAQQQQAMQAQPQAEAGQGEAPGAPPAQAQQQRPVDGMRLVQQWARKLSRVEDPAIRDKLLSELQKRNPTIAAEVARSLPALSEAAMAPLPEQRPPRRREAII